MLNDTLEKTGTFAISSFATTTSGQSGSSSVTSPRSRTSTDALKSQTPFLGFAAGCAACGADAPRELSTWLGCMGCHQLRYCSAACRRDGWSWGHSQSCAKRPPPNTPAAVASLSSEHAAEALKEHGRAHAGLAVCSMRRVLTDLQSHFENEYRPSAETIGEKARAHVRVSCAVAKGAVFPAHAAQAVEQGIRRTVMAWGDKGRGGTGDQRELYKATSDTLEDNYSSSRPAAVG